MLPLLALLAGSLAATASAQEFAPGMGEAMAALRAEAAAQRTQSARLTARAAAARPRRKRHNHHMHGGSVPSAGKERPDVSAYPIRGIDVSHYQLTIDWDQVRTAGLSFVYVKATDGDDIVDDQFAANWAGASRAGLLKGAYHFWDFCSGGREQAALFVQTVPNDVGVLPPTIDLEENRECSKMPPRDEFLADLADFVSAVRAAYGREPVLYVNTAIWARYLKDSPVAGYTLWVADVNHKTPVLQAPWAIWQYGWHGAVPGITGEVDLDAFAGTPQMLASLVNQPSGIIVARAPQPDQTLGY